MRFLRSLIFWRRRGINRDDHSESHIAEEMMYNTFNMGLGMVIAVDPADADQAMEAIRTAGEQPYVVGRVEAGDKGVTLC